MKKTILFTIVYLTTLHVLHARTWTSAQGGKTFEGDYVSHTDKMVTVKKNYKSTEFSIDLLSEADKKWIIEQPKASEANKDGGKSDSKNSEPGAIGKKLEGKIVKLDGKKYKKYEQEKTPEYYLVYFSASW